MENGVWVVRVGGMAGPQLQAVFAQTGAAKALLSGERQGLLEITPKVMHEEKIIYRIFNPGFLTKQLVAGGFSCRM